MRPLEQCLGLVPANSTNPERLADDVSILLETRIVDRQDGKILISPNARHAEFVIHKADQDGLCQTGLEAVSPDAVDQIRARAEKAGLKVLSTTPSLPAIARSVTFATSEGHVYEVHTPLPHDRAALSGARCASEMCGPCEFHFGRSEALGRGDERGLRLPLVATHQGLRDQLDVSRRRTPQHNRSGEKPCTGGAPYQPGVHRLRGLQKAG
jgi:hypothetical protein